MKKGYLLNITIILAVLLAQHASNINFLLAEPTCFRLTPGLKLNYTMYIFKNNDMAPIGYLYYEVKPFNDTHYKIIAEYVFHSTGYSNKTVYTIRRDGYINKKLGYTSLIIPANYKKNSIRMDGIDSKIRKTLYGYVVYGTQKKGNMTITYTMYYDGKGFLKRSKARVGRITIYTILSSWNIKEISPYSLKRLNKNTTLRYEILCCDPLNLKKIGVLKYHIWKVHGYLTIVHERMEIEGKKYNYTWIIDSDTCEDIMDDKQGSLGLWIPQKQKTIRVQRTTLKLVFSNNSIMLYYGHATPEKGEAVNWTYIYNSSFGILLRIEYRTKSEKDGKSRVEIFQLTRKSATGKKIFSKDLLVYTSISFSIIALALYLYSFFILKRENILTNVAPIFFVVSAIPALFVKENITWMVITITAFITAVIKLALGRNYG